MGAMEIWIYFTLLAATMQAVRTAGQKQLTSQLSRIATTSVRYVFALPFAWAYLYWMIDYQNIELPALNQQFLLYAFSASIAQLLGTLALVAAFSYRNFAVASSLSKTEAIQVAIIGALFFSAPLSAIGWISVVLGVIGVIILSKVKFSWQDVMHNPGAGFGLASGLGLAMATLLIRESSLSLNTHLMVSAAVTLVFLITVQAILSFAYIAIKEREQFAQIFSQWRLCLFVGTTSLIGSIGWFTAASYQTAAYVKALGQVEFFITLLLTYKVFKEKVTFIEYVGMFAVIVSVVMLLLWA